MDGQVLVLNQNYEPLNITNVQRAITLLYLGKAELIEAGSWVIRSERMAMPAPSVVRLSYFVKRPFPQLHPTRRSLLARDDFTCQYCGRKDGGLTLDHIIPKVRGGTDDWNNLVCCCTRCNNLKGNRTPEEAGMTLLRKPRRPGYVPYVSYPKFVAACRNQRWLPYLAPYVAEGE